jgi:ribonuclease Z
MTHLLDFVNQHLGNIVQGALIRKKRHPETTKKKTAHGHKPMARPSFTARLVNSPFDDPGLLISFQYQRRALLFDLGDVHALSPRDLLKISHVFVTHTHMDHFVGFDTLLRVSLGRDKELQLFGPAGFFERVEGKLAGYTWNLVDAYPYNLRLRVTEVGEERCRTREYRCKERFLKAGHEGDAPVNRVLVREPAFRIEAVLLDHRIPCLGLSLIGELSVNIDKEALKDLGLPVGPWLASFKQAVAEKSDPDRAFSVVWEEEGKISRERTFPFGELKGKIARISPGQKVTYLTDLLGSPENLEKAVELARGADTLFVEAAFLDRDKETARTKWHLTAKEAGSLARKAGVKQMTLFHFSPRYSDLEEEIRKEAMEAFGKG